MGRGVFTKKLLGRKVKFTIGRGEDKSEKEGEIIGYAPSGDGSFLYIYIVYDGINFAQVHAPNCTLVKPLEDNTED